jgi:NADH-quinone oxidoreductase subunit J
MTITAEAVIFFVFAVPLVATALGVVLSRSPVYAAMNLVAAFFCMAGLYVLLTAHLVAFMQVLVYAGAVMVLFLFVIMLLSLGDEHLVAERKTVMQLAGVAGGLGVFAVLVTAIWQATGLELIRRDGLFPRIDLSALFAAPSWAAVKVDFGTVKAVGSLLFNEYLLPFEATSLLLLVAIVGAVVVAKERI